MMRILFIVPELCGDGPSRAIAQIAAYVPRDRFDLRVCSLSRASVAYESLPAVRSLDCDSVFDVRTYSRVRALIREWQPDVVHTQLLRPDWYGRAAARAEKVRAVCTTVQNEDDVTNRESYGRIAASMIAATRLSRPPAVRSRSSASRSRSEAMTSRRSAAASAMWSIGTPTLGATAS